MLPNEWKLKAVEEVGKVQAGRQRSPHFTKGVRRPYLRVANVFDGRIDTSDINEMHFTDAEFARYELRKGDILLNEGQSLDLVGRPAIYSGLPESCCFQNTLIRFRPSAEIDSEFALKRFQLCLYDGTFKAIAKKTTSIAHLGVSRFARLKISWPPLPEQRRIARILSTWDQAIATIEGLLANACTQRKTLTNALFVHGRHSSMTTHGWKFADLDEVFERVTRRNTTANSNVLTISGTRGLVSQRDYFNKSVASENLSGYTLIERGEFAYNKSYSAGYPMGAIKPLTRYDQGVVSSLYICFRLRDGVEADADFFRHYFEVGMLNEGLSGIAQEGARNHGLLNVGVGDFFKLRLHIPDVTEQRRVAAILNMAEQKEQLITAQLDKLRDEKKALMSQLLTGKRRVRLPADEAAHA
ncbi:restriction endonuclease subunit S [Xanthomonas campestris pv. incanae]|uniref:restriction endonuclease subunit S n=1 Tax=Xanthomonas campestris TaxID=339 RepID=UPI003F4D17A6